MTEDAKTPVPTSARFRSTGIKNWNPTLPERGKIKIGMKGEKRKKQGKDETYQLPVKLDHFLITTMDRGPDGNFVVDDAAHKKLGDKTADHSGLKRIPIRFVYDDMDLNFPSRLASFNGRKLWCSGDNEIARRWDDKTKSYLERECPCPLADPEYTGNNKCKWNGALGVMIQGLGGIGGVHKFRTTGFNSINGMRSSMLLLKQITGGPLAGIPFWLAINPKQATAPDGSQQTIYVVSLDFDGDEGDLEKRGYEIARRRADAHLRIENVEQEARRQLQFAPDNVPLPGDEPEEIGKEFYPEEHNRGDADAPKPPQRQDFKKGPDNVIETFALFDETGVQDGDLPLAEYEAEVKKRIEKLVATDPKLAKTLLENNIDELARAGMQILIGDLSERVLQALKASQPEPDAEPVKDAEPSKDAGPSQAEAEPDPKGLDDYGDDPKAADGPRFTIRTLDGPRGARTWQTFCDEFSHECLAACKSKEDVDKLWKCNSVHWPTFEKADKELFGTLVKKAQNKKKELSA